jgi:hypothetical protein
MTNQDIIDKLILGTNDFEEVKITVKGEELPVQLRPLNSGELSELRKMEKKPFTMKMNMNSKGKIRDVKKEASKQSMDIGMADFTDSQAETLYTAVAWSMDVDVEAVKGFKVGVPEAIFSEVIRISNLPDDLEVVKQFRK